MRKLAARLDGIDLSAYRVGDVLDLAPSDAATLVAERWAVRCEAAPALSNDLIRLRELRGRMDARFERQQERRRAEDRIREELRDERAVVIGPPAWRRHR